MYRLFLCVGGVVGIRRCGDCEKAILDKLPFAMSDHPVGIEYVPAAEKLENLKTEIAKIGTDELPAFAKKDTQTTVVL